MRHLIRHRWMLCLSTIALLAFAPAVWAGGDKKHDESEKMKKKEAHTIHGCFAVGDEEGHYEITKMGEEGKTVKVKGPAEFANHDGHEVKITGHWKKKKTDDGEKVKYFVGKKMEHIAATCG